MTAGNSSGINDGAAALLLCEAEAARRLGLRRWRASWAAHRPASRPTSWGSDRFPRRAKRLRASACRTSQLDLVEINEAFAAQAIACMRDLEFDARITNLNGGAIALGHPLGASGARIVTTLLHELRRRNGRYGLATMCIGVGQGIATVFERVELKAAT